MAIGKQVSNLTCDELCNLSQTACTIWPTTLETAKVHRLALRIGIGYMRKRRTTEELSGSGLDQDTRADWTQRNIYMPAMAVQNDNVTQQPLRTLPRWAL